MPNWNYNRVEIHAPQDAVMAWLIPWTDVGTYHFNMHLLFPETFAAGDEKGDKARNYRWSLDNTGSQWAPEVYLCGGDSGLTVLDYDSAWSPNNGTLQRLHDKTWWTIRNDYREEGMHFCGAFICEGGTCRDEDKEYFTICEVCEEGRPEDQYDEDHDDLICNDCRAKAKLIS